MSNPKLSLKLRVTAVQHYRSGKYGYPRLFLQRIKNVAKRRTRRHFLRDATGFVLKSEVASLSFRAA